MSSLPFNRPFCQLAALASGALLALGGVSRAEDDPGKAFDALQQSIQSVFSKCRSAVVRIEAVDHQGQLSGTGFFIDPNGTLYTCYSVGGESRDIQVTLGKQRYTARRLVGDRRSGIAILKIDAETPFLPFGHSRQLPLAAPVVSIGFPMDLPLTPTFGTVAGFDLKHQDRFFVTTHLRANIAVQRGEGGAPLLNTKGEVVGILISRLDSGTASFVLPIEAAEKVRKDFLRFHEVRPGWIGMQVKALPEPVAGSSAFIEEVIADSPAEKAGLHIGDILLQVGDLKVAAWEDMIDASFFLSAEDETVVRVSRGGVEREFNVVPIDHPYLRGSRFTGDFIGPILKEQR
jgi:serine protease Do